LFVLYFSVVVGRWDLLALVDLFVRIRVVLRV